MQKKKTQTKFYKGTKLLILMIFLFFICTNIISTYIILTDSMIRNITFY